MFQRPEHVLSASSCTAQQGSACHTHITTGDFIIALTAKQQQRGVEEERRNETPEQGTK